MIRKRQILIFTILLPVMVISACENLPFKRTTESPEDAVETIPQEWVLENSDQTAPEITPPVPVTTPSVDTQQPVLEMGTGVFTASPAAKKSKQVSVEAGDITLNFQDTDLREFIKVTLGDVLGSNFIIDPKVGGKVTMETPSPISKEELLPLLEEVLAVNGAAIIKVGDYYKILPRDQAARGNIAPSMSLKLSPTMAQKGETGFGARIIPLQYIAAQEMEKILEPLLPKDSKLRVDKKRNLMIFSGTPEELALIQETVDIFDVDWMRGMSMALYPLEYVEAKDLKKELDSVIGAYQDESGKELLDGLIRAVPIERLNSMLLISSTLSALHEVETWVNRLDKPGKHVGQRLYVYNVQNAKATELAELLGKIFGGSQFQQSMVLPPVTLAPGTTPVDITSGETQPTAPVSVGETGVALPTSSTIEIIADDTRNALVILATPQEYKMVEAAIERLDVVPLQVLIEASIIEVGLNDDLNYGVEWFFKNDFEGKTGEGRLDLGNTSGGIKTLSPSFSYSIVDTAANIRVVLNALASESDVKVLSSPSLMVLDNETAVINVGDEIPIPSRQAVSNIDPNAPTVNEIEYRQTGVTLTVTPRVNNSGLVTMEIKQEVSDAVTTTTSAIDAPTIQQRAIESTVAINSGETIVLGGMIRDVNTDAESGIPVLYKLPLIGKLFGTTRIEARRTELLVLITPKVVGNRNEARDVTEEFRNKLKGLKL